MRIKVFFIFVLTCCLCVIARQQVFAFDIKQSLLNQKELSSNQEWLNLLHYHHSKSLINKGSNFFLASRGYQDPQAEYEAVINGLFDETLKDNASILCRYPARVNYIMQATKTKAKDIPSQKCSDYLEYQRKMPIDKVYVVFAAENNQSPSSMLGHTFLKIEGQQDDELRQHSFSYFAALNNANSLKFYLDVMSTGLDGAYVLSPYQAKANDYLYSEQRSLWEFELAMSSEEKERLKMHLWELKEKNIRYKFVTHNCNTALMSILKTSSTEFAMDTIKPFITPIEYIQNLQAKEKIFDISIKPTQSQKKAIEKFGLNYIGNAPKPQKISLGQDLSNNLTNITFSPVYQDIRNVSNAYFPDLESKILDLSVSYWEQNEKAVVDKIDVLKMISVIDYSLSNSYSKYFRLGFENDLFAEDTELKPVMEFGLGIGKKIATTTFYVLPKIGYHYDKFSNFYLIPQLGAITRISDKIKIINSYEKYFNSKADNKGFKERYNFFVGYKVFSNTDIYFDYSHYNIATHTTSVSIGFSFHF